MTSETKPQKPKPVRYAEWTLWLWTAWVCLFGIYQTPDTIVKIEQAITDQLQGMISIDPHQLWEWMIGGYIIGALGSAWFVLKIGEGKHWARSSFLWCFVLEIAWTACSPIQGAAEYIAAIPDFALQAIALYWLYAKPGRNWFPKPKR